MKKILGIILIAVGCLSLAIPAFAANGENVIDSRVNQNILQIEDSKAISPEEKVKMAKEVIAEFYGEVDQANVQLIGDMVEANEFGGLYLDDDGKLVVNIVGAELPTIQEYSKSAKSNDIEFKQVNYSLSELTEIFETLVPFMADYSILLLDANDITNKVDICLSDFSDENIKAISSYLTKLYPTKNLTDILNFIDNTGIMACCEAPKVDEAILSNDQIVPKTNQIETQNTSLFNPTYIVPGVGILIEGYQYTLGPQHPDYSSYFYTAGHGVEVGDSVTYLYNGLFQSLGSVVAQKFSGNSDSSCIGVPSTVEQHSALSYFMVNPIAGTSVKMVGATSGATSGTVSRVDATVTYDDMGVTLTNMAQANYSCAGGDSGGPIYNNYPTGGTVADITTCYGVQSGGLFYEVNEEKVWAGTSFFTMTKNLV